MDTKKRVPLYSRLCAIERKCERILRELDEVKRLVKSETIDGLIGAMRREAKQMRRMSVLERKRLEHLNGL